MEGAFLFFVMITCVGGLLNEYMKGVHFFFFFLVVKRKVSIFAS